MYLHLALPDRAQVDALMSIRGSGCVSIYLATDPAGDSRAERIETSCGSNVQQHHGGAARSAGWLSTQDPDWEQINVKEACSAG